MEKQACYKIVLSFLEGAVTSHPEFIAALHEIFILMKVATALNIRCSPLYCVYALQSWSPFVSSHYSGK